ncbi:unnamed protein product [Ixodes pacificus]
MSRARCARSIASLPANRRRCKSGLPSSPRNGGIAREPAPAMESRWGCVAAAAVSFPNTTPSTWGQGCRSWPASISLSFAGASTCLCERCFPEGSGFVRRVGGWDGRVRLPGQSYSWRPVWNRVLRRAELK